MKGAESGLSQARQLFIVSGIVALLGLALVPEGDASDRIALVAFTALSFGTAITWLQVLVQSRRSVEPDQVSVEAGQVVEAWGSRAWVYMTILVGGAAAVVVQTWFKPATSIAGGDIEPPQGTAWLERLFDPWIWSGSSLGEPSQLPLQLPWAAVLRVVTVFHGDPALAQRLWYTLIFVGATLGIFAFLASVRMGPVAAFLGSVVYVLNPYVVSEVNTYAVFMVALGLLAALPAVIVAVGTNKLSVLWGAILIALAAPLLGYAFLNPPLVGLILAALVCTPLLVAWTDGHRAALRSTAALVLAGPLLIGASAYWIVPSVLHLTEFSGSQLVGLSTWAWTEGRATLRNGFWLNAVWAWSFRQYFPYAPIYDSPAFKAAEFASPAIAFSALGVLARGIPIVIASSRYLRLTLVASTIALMVILISTGTNPPGNAVFNHLYGLPFGWLLREPGRFLMLVGLAYAVLIASLVQTLLTREWARDFIRTRQPSTGWLRFAVAPLVIAAMMLVGFPLYTGAVVPDERPGLPPVHVAMPSYWTDMARYVNDSRKPGSLMVMPPDDFYQMPYKWGYYGTDNFVGEMFRRPVINPNAQGYYPASSELLQTTSLMAQAIISHDWPQVERIVRILNAPLILVRRDVEAQFPQRSIVRPDDLSTALATAPNFVLVYQAGLLDLYSLIGTTVDHSITRNFATIDSQTPDLRLLSILPPDQQLVTSESLPGVPSVVESPPVHEWVADGSNLVWRPTSPPGQAYELADLESKAVTPLARASTATGTAASPVIQYLPDSPIDVVTVSVPTQSVISNGDFTRGPWAQFTDCHAVNPQHARLDAAVIPNAAPTNQPALRLSAAIDAACEVQPLSWSGGALVIKLLVHHVSGSAPRICLWETGPERCAQLPAISAPAGWSTFRASVTPDKGTTAIALYLYADGGATAGETVNEYADVRVVQIGALPQLALISNPGHNSNAATQLALARTSYSSLWQFAPSGRHVLVDGMFNGWLVPLDVQRFTATYSPSGTFRLAHDVSMGTLMILLLAAAILIGRRKVESLRWPRKFN
jgi:arabinofuranan 3-O-arabinosyltransferase